MAAIAQSRPGQLSAKQVPRIRSRQTAEPVQERAVRLEPVLAEGWSGDWERLSLLALSDAGCVRCEGSGRMSHRSCWRPCGCVLRRICRAVMAKHYELSRTYPMARVTAEKGYMFGWPREEFLADVSILVRRTLAGTDRQVVELHMMARCDWRACCAQLRMDRGNFFHSVYRTQERLGRVFVERGPLYPTWRYLSRKCLPIIWWRSKVKVGTGERDEQF